MQFSFSVTSGLFSAACCRAARSDADRSEFVTARPSAAKPLRDELSDVRPAQHSVAAWKGGNSGDPDENVERYSARLLDEFFDPADHPVLQKVVEMAYAKSAVFRQLLNSWGRAQSPGRSDGDGRGAANRASCDDSLQVDRAAQDGDPWSRLGLRREVGATACRPFVHQLVQAMLLGRSKAEELVQHAIGHTHLVMREMDGSARAGMPGAAANSPGIRRYPGRAFLQGEVVSVRQHGLPALPGAARSEGSGR
jgi:hypothetical protein